MYPSAERTQPDRRFFITSYGEVEHHPSFSTDELPQVRVLKGRTPYAVVDEENSTVRAYRIGLFENIHSGSAVRLVTTTKEKHQDILSKSALRQLDNPEDMYVPRPEDRLILQADLADLPWKAPLRKRVGRQSVLLHPFGSPLPFVDDRPEGEERDAVRFRLHGVISGNNKLVAWGEEGKYAQWLVDACVVAEHARTRLELDPLVRYLRIGDISLRGSLGCNVAAEAYLTQYDTLRSTTYVPTVDPRQKLEQLPA
jgi:hypothetical protein